MIRDVLRHSQLGRKVCEGRCVRASVGDKAAASREAKADNAGQAGSLRRHVTNLLCCGAGCLRRSPWKGGWPALAYLPLEAARGCRLVCRCQFFRGGVFTLRALRFK